MSVSRPTPVTLLSIWEAIVFAFGSFSLVSAYLLRAANSAAPPAPALQTACAVISLLLALGAAITLWQMKPIAWQLLAGRVVIDLVALIAMKLHPPVMPANVMSTPNGATVASFVTTGTLIFGAVMLIVNIGLAWYAYSATSKATHHQSTAPAAS